MIRFVSLMVVSLFLYGQAFAQCNVDMDEDEFQPICYTWWGMYATELAPWAIEEPGWSYSWLPTTGLDNPNILHPMANPMTTTTYTLTVTAPGCGTFVGGTSRVEVMPATPAITPAGPVTYTYMDTSLLVLKSNAPYGGWYKNDVLVQGCCNDSLIVTYSTSSNVTDYYRYYSPYSCERWSNIVEVNYIGCGICRVTLHDTPADVSGQKTDKVKAIGELASIKLFPNPASTRLTISCKNPIREVEIINIAGVSVKRMHANGSSPYSFGIEDIPNGYYICSIKLTSGVKQLPFIVKR
ncbi:T9SS type A sorting domain-containing protein [Chitinophaga sp. XS-30]|uniref:T9SS type A sorting domain-containing protein n=1 Tax=Chitinophaga sp. XS-30 TaxID=2604421 RepID=UPI0011DDEB07|nr:T9SS type A sorting domain-containing protein [Chitinophaga sp. XS-30]QEH39449.1 T9SS type A sorting domain-containing protein [Chitinophaga sp. XS-30]